MNIIISNKSGIPIYEQIIKEIKDEIIKGDLEKDSLLPSIRNLARELRVSVITVKKAYEELEREGYVYTIRGKGTFVADANLDLIKKDKSKEIEKELLKTIDNAKSIGLNYEALKDILKTLWYENKK